MKAKASNKDNVVENKISSLRFYIQGRKFITYNIGILLLSVLAFALIYVFAPPQRQVNDPMLWLLTIFMSLIFMMIRMVVSSIGMALYSYYGVLASQKKIVPPRTIMVSILNKLSPIIGLYIVFNFMMPLFMVLCLPLGVYIFNRLSLAQYFLVEENLTTSEALRKSWRTVKGRWWEVLSIHMIPSVFILPVIIILTTIWQIVLMANSKTELLLKSCYSFSEFIHQTGVIPLIILTVVPVFMYIALLGLINYPLATINMARMKTLITDTKDRISIWPAIVGLVLCFIFMMQIISGLVYKYYMSSPSEEGVQTNQITTNECSVPRDSGEQGTSVRVSSHTPFKQVY